MDTGRLSTGMERVHMRLSSHARHGPLHAVLRSLDGGIQGVTSFRKDPSPVSVRFLGRSSYSGLLSVF